jgi:hypothetical protein
MNNKTATYYDTLQMAWKEIDHPDLATSMKAVSKYQLWFMCEIAGQLSRLNRTLKGDPDKVN